MSSLEDDNLTSDFSSLSIRLTRELESTTKKTQGIYFTPYSTVSHLIKTVRLLIPLETSSSHSILEPSCGSGQFLSRLHSTFPHSGITGIELEPDIFQHLPSFPKTTLIKGDFLDSNLWLATTDISKFDLIIGNPPFRVVKKSEVPDSITSIPELYGLLEGRPNLFILFILRSVSLLRPGGIIAMVLPKNFLNCLYYSRVRQYLATNFQIKHIVTNNDKYLDTNQDTICLVLKHYPQIQHDNLPPDNSKYCWNPSGYQSWSYFQPSSLQQILPLVEDATTLNRLGYRVGVGTVVWNQSRFKDRLTSDASKTRLIYSGEIDQGSLLAPGNYRNPARKNFITLEGWTHPCIVVNRGYGTGGYCFQYALLDPSSPETPDSYLIENHLVYIVKKDPHPEDIIQFKKIIASFGNPKTREFIRLYFGNNAINTTELQHILPIFV